MCSGLLTKVVVGNQSKHSRFSPWMNESKSGRRQSDFKSSSSRYFVILEVSGSYSLICGAVGVMVAAEMVVL